MNKVEESVEKFKSKEISREELYEALADFIALQQKACLTYTKGGTIEQGELLSLIWLGIEEAAMSFKPEKGCAFLTWATNCIRYRILTEIKRLTYRHVSLDATFDESQALSLSETVDDPSAEEDFKAADDKALAKTALSKLKTLKNPQKELIYLTCVRDMPLQSAAKKLNLSVTRARRIQISGLCELQKALVGEPQEPQRKNPQI